MLFERHLAPGRPGSQTRPHLRPEPLRREADPCPAAALSLPLPDELLNLYAAYGDAEHYTGRLTLLAPSYVARLSSRSDDRGKIKVAVERGHPVRVWSYDVRNDTLVRDGESRYGGGEVGRVTVSDLVMRHVPNE